METPVLQWVQSLICLSPSEASFSHDRVQYQPLLLRIQQIEVVVRQSTLLVLMGCEVAIKVDEAFSTALLVKSVDASQSSLVEGVGALFEQ